MTTIHIDDFSLQEDVHRLNENAMPFPIRDLSLHRFGYLWRVLKPIPHGYQGITMYVIESKGSIIDAAV
jgi:hypothetical protein